MGREVSVEPRSTQTSSTAHHSTSLTPNPRQAVAAAAAAEVAGVVVEVAVEAAVQAAVEAAVAEAAVQPLPSSIPTRSTNCQVTSWIHPRRNLARAEGRPVGSILTSSIRKPSTSLILKPKSENECVIIRMFVDLYKCLIKTSN